MMHNILEYHVLTIIRKRGNIWKLANCGFTTIEIFNCLQKLKNRKLVTSDGDSYKITTNGISYMDRLRKDKRNMKDYLLNQDGYRVNPLNKDDVYISVNFLLETARNARDIKSLQ